MHLPYSRCKTASYGRCTMKMCIFDITKTSTITLRNLIKTTLVATRKKAFVFCCKKRQIKAHGH